MSPSWIPTLEQVGEEYQSEFQRSTMSHHPHPWIRSVRFRIDSIFMDRWASLPVLSRWQIDLSAYPTSRKPAEEGNVDKEAKHI